MDTRDPDESPSMVRDSPKPAELLAMASVSRKLFDYLKSWFDVPNTLVIDLSCIDSEDAIRSMQNRQMVAGFAMRKLQALHLISTPGIPTRADVVLMLIDSALQALLEAPRGHLTRQIATVDWDREWKVLDAGLLLHSPTPQDADDFTVLLHQILQVRPLLMDIIESGNAPLI